jgi:hypothetical protein
MTMTTEEPISRTRTEVRELLREVEAVYALGGPPTGPGGAWEPVEDHGYILAVLDHSDMATFDLFAAALRDARIATPAGLRAFLRLVAARAQIAVLTWILDEPDGFHPTGHVATRDEVLDEASAIAHWDQSDW